MSHLMAAIEAMRKLSTYIIKWDKIYEMEDADVGMSEVSYNSQTNIAVLVMNSERCSPCHINPAMVLRKAVVVVGNGLDQSWR